MDSMADLLAAATPAQALPDGRAPAGAPPPPAPEPGPAHGGRATVDDGVVGGGDGASAEEALEPARPAAARACLLSVQMLLASDGRSLVFSPSQDSVQARSCCPAAVRRSASKDGPLGLISISW
jgi:hypothetical protein